MINYTGPIECLPRPAVELAVPLRAPLRLTGLMANIHLALKNLVKHCEFECSAASVALFWNGHGLTKAVRLHHLYTYTGTRRMVADTTAYRSIYSTHIVRHPTSPGPRERTRPLPASTGNLRAIIPFNPSSSDGYD